MCCGGSQKPMRVQPIPPRPQTVKHVTLKPISTAKIFPSTAENNNNQNTLVPQKLPPTANKPVEENKCKVCGHPMMIHKIAGRSRLQCTNFSCRAIL